MKNTQKINFLAVWGYIVELIFSFLFTLLIFLLFDTNTLFVFMSNFYHTLTSILAIIVAISIGVAAFFLQFVNKKEFRLFLQNYDGDRIFFKSFFYPTLLGIFTVLAYTILLSNNKYSLFLLYFLTTYTITTLINMIRNAIDIYNLKTEFQRKLDKLKPE